MTHAFPTRRASELALLARQGTRYANLIGRFTGPTAVTTSTDPVSAAKAIVEFANSNDKLTIVGGGLGERALSPDEVKALAKTPSLDDSRAKLVGLLQDPASRIVGVLVAPAGGLAREFAARVRNRVVKGKSVTVRVELGG